MTASQPGAARPPHVADFDDQLRAVLKPLHRTRWLGLVCFAAVAAVAVVVLSLVAFRQAAINEQQATRLAASCQFYRDIATAPIVTPPGAKHPGILGVKIVVDSYKAYIHQGCGPPALRATPSLRHWAGFFKLSLAADSARLLPLIGPHATAVPTPTAQTVSHLGTPHAPQPAPGGHAPQPTVAPQPQPTGPLPTPLPTLPTLPPTPTLPVPTGLVPTPPHGHAGKGHHPHPPALGWQDAG